MATAAPGAREWVPERSTLSRLREAAQGCRGCELYRDATQAVMGDGPDGAPLMVVGEQPGDKEDLAGEPFVGPAGRLLDRALEEAGIEPRAVFRTNVVKHFRFSGTRGKQRIHKSPGQVHITACGPWLAADTLDVAPDAAPEWVLPTTHPSSVLRSRDRDTDLAALVADLTVAAEALTAGDT